MRDVKEVNAKAAAEKARHFLETYTIQEKTYSNGGCLWPSGKWQTEGFDAEAIERLTPAEDIQEHAILGRCYRVAIPAKAERGAEGGKRCDSTSFLSKQKDLMKGLRKLHGDEEDNADETSNSDTTSESSSSAKKGKSSSSKKKSKDAKKAKKAAKKLKKKEDQRKRKHAEEEAEKKLLVKQAKKEYGSYIRKGERAYGDLQATMASAGFLMKVPDFYRSEAVDAARGLREAVDAWTESTVDGTAVPQKFKDRKNKIIDEADKMNNILEAMTK